MKTIEVILKKECQQLKEIIRESRKRLQNVPQGHLRIAKKKNRLEYYYINEDEKNMSGRYLKKSEEYLAKRIVQRDYDTYIIKYATERIKVIDKFLENYEKTILKMPERNGIYLGVNLFVTYETSKKPLNVRALDEMIRKLWVEESMKE